MPTIKRSRPLLAFASYQTHSSANVAGTRSPYKAFGFTRLRMSGIASAMHTILVTIGWLGSTIAAPALLTEPYDRQVAEWAILQGGNERLEGRADCISYLTQFSAEEFHLE